MHSFLPFFSSILYFFFFELLSQLCHADVSFGSIHPSLSSSLSEDSDSDNSIATRLAKIDATSWKVLERSFASVFSTVRSLMPEGKKVEN